jgi:hypothetical protein
MRSAEFPELHTPLAFAARDPSFGVATGPGRPQTKGISVTGPKFLP